MKAREDDAGSAGYASLMPQAMQIQELAIRKDLESRGFAYHDGAYFDTAQSSEVVQQAVDVTVARYSGVAAMFTPFYSMPDPASFAALSASLASIATKLTHDQTASLYGGDIVTANPALGALDDVKGLVKDWYGGGARSFKKNFLTPWYAITANQRALILTLKSAADAERAMWQQARTDVATLAQKTIDALQCLPLGNDASFQFAVLGSFLAVAAAVTALPTGGASAAVAVTVLSEVAGSASANTYPEPKDSGYENASVQGIIGDLQGYINALISQINQKEDEIRDAMNRTLAAADEGWAMFVAPRPMLADATATSITSDQFGLGKAEG